MWIRTQDKMNLINNPLRIYVDLENRIKATMHDECICLGKYNSKERALEVLDEIQKIVSPNFNFNGSNEEADLFVKTQILNCMIRFYQMPEV